MSKETRKVVSLNMPPKTGGVKLNEVQDDGKNLYVERIQEESLEDSVYMSPLSYKAIFNKKRSDDTGSRRRLAVVKITSPLTRRSIYRKYVFCQDYSGITDKNLALHPSSIRELGDNETIVGSDVIVSRGCVLCYFWKHPFHATRISTKLGIISILLAIISIAITIVLSCHCC